MSQTRLLWAVIVVFAVVSAVLLVQNLNLRKELQQDQAALTKSVLNQQAVTFLQAFVDKVLRAQGEVSFDDRLQLENMVRDLKDDAILAEWNKFVNSQTPAAAQEEVKNLLELLTRKIQT
jgi:hypothetical protein